jgi:molecular chaperone GrpE
MEMKNQAPSSQAPWPEEAMPVQPDVEPEAQQTNGTGDAAAAADTFSPEALQEQLAQQRRQAEEYLENLQRLQADFNNYRRRASQEKLQAVSRGKEEVLRAMFPILGNLHLALQHAEQDANAVRQGVQMIWQQFESFLRDQGVERVATVGQPFDPAQHEALSTVPATAEAPANTVVSEVNAGYMLEGRLLRPAQVVVARAADTAAVTDAAATPSPSLPEA